MRSAGLRSHNLATRRGKFTSAVCSRRPLRVDVQRYAAPTCASSHLQHEAFRCVQRSPPRSPRQSADWKLQVCRFEIRILQIWNLKSSDVIPSHSTFPYDNCSVLHFADSMCKFEKDIAQEHMFAEQELPPRTHGPSHATRNHAHARWALAVEFCDHCFHSRVW